MWIGINQAADRAVLRRNLGLNAAPGMSVARNHDRTLHGYAELFQLLVILRDSVVHVNQRRGNISIPRERIERWQLLGLLIGSGILRQAGLFEFRREFRLAIAPT